MTDTNTPVVASETAPSESLGEDVSVSARLGASMNTDTTPQTVPQSDVPAPVQRRPQGSDGNMVKAGGKKNITKVDYLTEEPTIPGQQWFCASFISPEGILNCNLRAFKVYESFPTFAEASEKAQKLMEKDNRFHVFVGQVGKWVEFDPDPNSIKDQKYCDEGLQNLMQGYLDNQEKSKKLHEERVARVSQTAGRGSEIRDRLRKTLDDKGRMEALSELAGPGKTEQDSKSKDFPDNISDTTSVPPTPSSVTSTATTKSKKKNKNKNKKKGKTSVEKDADELFEAVKQKISAGQAVDVKSDLQKEEEALKKKNSELFAEQTKMTVQSTEIDKLLEKMKPGKPASDPHAGHNHVQAPHPAGGRSTEVNKIMQMYKKQAARTK